MRALLAGFLALLGACSGLPDRVSGLRPRAPLFTTDSPRPSLRWESFPTDDVPLEIRDRVREVVYDLRLRDPQGSLIEAREGLPAPEHILERDLAPGMEYRWTVRARFTIDGRPRETQWTETPPYVGRWAMEEQGRGIPLRIEAKSP